MSLRCVCAAVLLVLAGVPAVGQLPPPQAPVENPVTEEKRVLGKILFWDEQLSSGRTISCGSCHISDSGGADPRLGVHPGFDEVFLTADDIRGSPGVKRADPRGNHVEDALFGLGTQVTRRAANSTIGAAYSPELLWDGRAVGTFVDPEDGTPRIAVGGALESQALMPILNDVEMAREGRTWGDVNRRLVTVIPLGYASDLPPDLMTALSTNPTYPELFQAAFGDPEINAERIAFAIATYERTLVADQTPWDAFMQGDSLALTPQQQEGWVQFQGQQCIICHIPPTFTNHAFRNIGVRPPEEDLGRQEVTGVVEDGGRFKVPGLRNSGLKSTFMHNGQLNSVFEAVGWYRVDNPARFPGFLDAPLPLLFGTPEQQVMADFVQNGLTDPRVAAEEFPFDRPTLHGGDMTRLALDADQVTLTWPLLQGAQQYNVYRGTLSSLMDGDGDGLPDGLYGDCVSDLEPDNSDGRLEDPDTPAPGNGFFYIKGMVEGGGVERGLGATGEGLARGVLQPCP